MVTSKISSKTPAKSSGPASASVSTSELASPSASKRGSLKNYWLIKSEPTTYSIDDLKADIQTPWTGIRSYQARNFMRDNMKIGDLCIFYHSSAVKPELVGAVGVAKVVSKPYPDPTAKDKKSDYYELNPKIIWDLVEIKFIKKFKRIVTLGEMKIDLALKDIMVIKRGMRLSIQPVSEKDFEYVKSLGDCA